MKPLYTQFDFDNSKANDKLPCECYQCTQTFMVSKKIILRSLSKKYRDSAKFCSNECIGKSRNKKILVKCNECEKDFLKSPHEIKKSKSGNNFCSRNCSGSYFQKHKKDASYRSKLEIFIEDELKKLFPNILFLFNDRKIIGYELDIYLPELNLAFEINGILHYEPIFGIDILMDTQKRDAKKIILTESKNIDFYVINTTSQKYFKKESSYKFLDIIYKIISSKN